MIANNNEVGSIKLHGWSKKHVKEVEKLNGIYQALNVGQGNDANYSLREGFPYHRGCLVIPATSPIIPLLLMHNSPTGGHQGVLKTFQRLAKELYWKGMKV